MTSLSRKRRLSSRDIARVLKEGKKKKGEGVSVWYAGNGMAVSRFAVVVSLRVAKKSVIRNKMRRQIKAVLHRMVPHMQDGYDSIIIAHQRFYAQKEIETILSSVLKTTPIFSQ